MKRENEGFHHIYLRDNLGLALYKALRGKRQRPDAREFLQNCNENLNALSDRIRSGGGPLGVFREFTIWDPKKRIISAPCFADRVLHHAMMNVCETAFERWLISQTHACRVGKGLKGAISEARKWSSSRQWYLQLDVRHYFETIPRGPLLTKVCHLFGEMEMLNLWSEVIYSHRTRQDKGMPIGALTSQFLANFYLGFVDRVVKEQLRIPAYARYMDDMVLWHDDKDTLLRARDVILAYVTDELGLVLKDPILNRTSGGMDFLGFRFHPGWVGLSRRSRRRLNLRIRSYEEAWAYGLLSEDELSRRATAALAFVEPAKCRRMRHRLVEESIYE